MGLRFDWGSKGVVYAYDILYQWVFCACEILGNENRNFYTEDNQEMQV